mmetsp:Transcript_104653/g.296155  ORF Transcript_104653/g.296155 Transcript_104653/m.296155 type:complete len:170 (-) Transcript_104653:78-587(-)
MSIPWSRCAKVAWVTVPPIIFFRDRIAWIYCVEGRSMSPTLNPQDSILDRCFRDRVLVYKNAVYQNGDVVILRDPGTNSRIVKRLVASENEFVPTSDGGVTFVPSGHCWVEGDNSQLSVDSRSFGAVPMGLLEALAFSVVWPFWRWRVLVEDEGESKARQAFEVRMVPQ